MAIVIKRINDVEGLVKQLPKQYARRTNFGKPDQSPFILIYFSSMRVVHSREVMKALKRISADEKYTLCFVGRDFTQEAREIIEKTNSLVVDSRWGSGFWTDQSHTRSRTSIASRVKINKKTTP